MLDVGHRVRRSASSDLASGAPRGRAAGSWLARSDESPAMSLSNSEPGERAADAGGRLAAHRTRFDVERSPQAIRLRPP